jgi:D-3-phosphoglycerate dehydrogenase
MKIVRSHRTSRKSDKSVNILVVDPIHRNAIRALQRRFHVTVALDPSRNQLKTFIKDADVVVIRSGVRLDRTTLRSARHLKIIARAGVGVDNIDCNTAVERGISVFNIPSESSRSVAEFTFGLILAVARRIPLADRQIRQSLHKKHELLGTELCGKTIGLIGLGRIGKEIANLARGFEMRVLACVQRGTRDRKKEAARQEIRLLPLHPLLGASDFVCVCLPLKPDTSNLIGLAQFKRMKRTAYLVDVSRAGIVNSTDLIVALRKRLIAGAALDVLSSNASYASLSKWDNVVLCPHIGAMTDDAQHRIGDLLVKRIVSALRGCPFEGRLA